MNQQQVPPEQARPGKRRPPNALGAFGLVLSAAGLGLTFCFWPAAALCVIGAGVSGVSLMRFRSGVAVTGLIVGVVGVIVAIIYMLAVSVPGQPGTETPTPDIEEADEVAPELSGDFPSQPSIRIAQARFGS